MATSTIMSTGQITLIDLTDQRPVSFYLQSPASKIQIYDVNTSTYSPDYTSNNLTISPLFFFGNDEHTNQLKEGNLKYTINGVEISALSGYASQTGNTLTITNNIGSSNGGAFGQDKLKIVASLIISENEQLKIKDPITGVAITNTLTADIEFVKVDTGASGVGIKGIRQLYILKGKDGDDNLIVPSKPNSPQELNGWSDQNPSWNPNEVQYLWICTETAYSDNTYSYTTPYTDENWATAAEAVEKMTGDFSKLRDQVDTLQGEIDSVIDTWYLAGNPNNLNNYPWYDPSKTEQEQDDPSYHSGDLYYDTESKLSYRFLPKENTKPVEYEWQLISNDEVSAALKQVAELQTVVDSKITIYYDSTEPDPDAVPLNKDDLWMPANGNFYKWDGENWVEANKIIDRIEVQYAENQSNTSTEGIEESDWSTATPEWKEGWYIWQRTVTYYREDERGIPSDASCISVAGAAGADAIYTIVESTDGRHIFTDGNPNNIILQAKLYIGGDIYGDGEEEKNISYNWTAIPESTIPSTATKTNSTLEIRRDWVPSAASFICTITYNEKDYSHSYAISDKTDPIYCEIESSNGNQFTNGQVTTTLRCRVFDGNGERDINGEEYEYSWTKYNKDSITPSQTHSGKIWEVDTGMVEGKAIFNCAVSRKSNS